MMSSIIISGSKFVSDGVEDADGVTETVAVVSAVEDCMDSDDARVSSGVDRWSVDEGCNITGGSDDTGSWDSDEDTGSWRVEDTGSWDSGDDTGSWRVEDTGSWDSGEDTGSCRVEVVCSIRETLTCVDSSVVEDG